MDDQEAKNESCVTEKVEGGEEEKEVVTMLDVLQDEQEMEENANAVLGAASETVCSHPSGYMTRQPLYACSTCSPPSCPDFKPGGICLACSYHCHEGHTLVELYTKRQFRCDCGTSRLPGPCKLGANKEENGLNKYNQNFSGLYCECSRPYPDPEDPVEDCMVQCVVCEDWYHGRHLGVDKLPEDSSYAEMLCRGCVTRHAFLQRYSGLAVTKVVKGEEGSKAEVVTEAGNCQKPAEVGQGEAAKDCASSVPSTEVPSLACTLPPCPPSLSPSSLFLPTGWRAQLCSCPSCIQLYNDAGTAFLTQETDTVHYYEAQAKETRGQFEQGMEALGQLDRVKQVEAIHSYNNMKENLMEYLAKFADSKKVVREEDIKGFFEEMKANKKQKIGGGPPSTCK